MKDVVHVHSENAPLWATQGGGVACSDGLGGYVWHELSDWMLELPDGSPDKAKLGDPVPKEWGLAPANAAASGAMLDEEYLLDW